MLKNLSRIIGAVAFGVFVRSILGFVVVSALIVGIFSGGLSVNLAVQVGEGVGVDLRSHSEEDRGYE